MSLPPLEEESDEPFAAERRSVANAKKAALLVAGAAAERFRDALAEQQEVLAHTADIVMQIYAMESALLRAMKLAEAHGAKAAVAADMARVLVSDSVEMIDSWAKQALAATLEGDELRTMLAALRRFTKYTPVNTAALRRSVADRAIELGRYPL